VGKGSLLPAAALELHQLSNQETFTEYKIMPKKRCNMKKRNLMKLLLNKETIASLNRIEMNESLAGAGPSDIGVSCYTGHCCYSRQECETQPEPYNNGNGNGTGYGTVNGNGHDG
jgi:hypothetical protein